MGLGALACSVGTASADSSDYAAAVKASTLGLGLELYRDLTPSLNARIGFNAFSQSEDFDEGGIDYSGDMDLQNAALLLDWHPFKGWFRLTGGAMCNGNEITLESGSINEIVEFGDDELTVNGKIDGTVDFNTFAPYFGFGWGKPIGEKGSRWSMMLDFGVMFQGTPDSDLSVSGTVTSDTAITFDGVTYAAGDALPTGYIDQETQKEEDELKKELDDFEIYPVVSIGISYQF